MFEQCPPPPLLDSCLCWKPNTTVLWQSPALSERGSYDPLEAVQQPKSISQGDKARPQHGVAQNAAIHREGEHTGRAFHGQRKGFVTKSC